MPKISPKDRNQPLAHGSKKPAVFAVLVLLAALLYASGMLERFVLGLGAFEYAGAFLVGIFYSYGMTTPFAIAVFAAMAGSMDPIALAALGACGAVMSDFLIFRVVASKSGKKLHITRKIWFGVPKISSPAGKFAAYACGAAILMSPLPDEIAMVLLGAGKMNSVGLVALAFAAKFAGILAIAGVSAWLL